MYEEMRKKAKKKVRAKMNFYTSVVVFSFTTILLLMLSVYIPSISFWLRLPIPLFIMILAVLYLSTFGLPFSNTHSDDWEEAEIEKEMTKLYRQKKIELPSFDNLSETEILELKELDRLQKKWDQGEDFV
jgi:hypothetical protein